jgi:hypothetical protein
VRLLRILEVMRGLLADSWPDVAGRLLRPSWVAEVVARCRSVVLMTVAVIREASLEWVVSRHCLTLLRRMMAGKDVLAGRTEVQPGRSGRKEQLEEPRDGRAAEERCRASPLPLPLHRGRQSLASYWPM